MKTKYKMTNWDAKKAFSETFRPLYYPSIYIDEYWDYYIEQLGLSDEWKDFLQKFTEYKFTYSSYKNEWRRIIEKSRTLIFNCPIEDISKKISEHIDEFPAQTEDVRFCEIPENKYLYIDIHNAFDTVLKYINIWNSEFDNIYDIIKLVTPYCIFHHNKQLKCSIYASVLNINDFNNMFIILSELLMKIKHSDKMELVNSQFTYFSHSGDTLLYTIDENTNIENIIGEYELDDIIKYHISTIHMKDIHMLNETYKCKLFTNDYINNVEDFIDCYKNQNLTNKNLYSLYYKLATNQKPNDKDLTIGYEDQIFFTLDKKDIDENI